jgi:glyoxylase-like metal-dependent hydrolase (beta-lactamase superfamily II)
MRDFANRNLHIMQRREFLKNGVVLIGALPVISVNKLNFLNVPSSMEVVRIKIGEFNCTIFRDLMFKYLAKDFFINANEQELNKALQGYHIRPDNIPSPFTPILIQQENKKILIDTGVGFSEKPVIVKGNSVVFRGKLHQENIRKEDITDVIITHFHPDHIGGIFNDDAKSNFPNARFHTHEDEWNYWHSSKSDNQPEQFKYFIQKNVTNLKDFNLNLIKGDFIDVLPGITVVKAEGHTAGQIAVVIHSEKENLLYISDTFLHPLHIERLDWQTNYDMDHEKARQSRIKIIELANKEDMLVNAFHFDFPGLGRIDKLANNWTWKYSEK